MGGWADLGIAERALPAISALASQQQRRKGGHVVAAVRLRAGLRALRQLPWKALVHAAHGHAASDELPPTPPAPRLRHCPGQLVADTRDTLPVRPALYAYKWLPGRELCHLGSQVEEVMLAAEDTALVLASIVTGSQPWGKCAQTRASWLEDA